MSHNTSLTTSDGVDLHASISIPENVKGSILIIHGLHDHSGRYDHVAEHFNKEGMATLQFDLRGSGRSAGLPGYIERFSDHIKDLTAAVAHLTTALPAPYFVFAHSMGALILGSSLLTDYNPFTGVIFSGGLFKVNEDLSPALQKVSGLVSAILPKLPTVKLDFTGLSRDPAVMEAVASDAYQYKGGVRARTGAEVLKATAALQERLSELDFPMLILHGEADPLTKYEASELLYDNSTSQDKTLKIYPSAKHEIFNEINRNEVLSDISAWIAARMS